MSAQTNTATKNVVLADSHGQSHSYTISYSRFGWGQTVLRPGWRIQGNGLNCIVNASDVQFPTPANIINQAHELFDVVAIGGAA